MVDANEVIGLSSLLKMTLSKQEEAEITHSLSEIIDMISTLETLPLEAYPPIAHPLELSLRCRPDAILNEAYQHSFEQTSPRFQKGFFTIPRVLDSE